MVRNKANDPKFHATDGETLAENIPCIDRTLQKQPSIIGIKIVSCRQQNNYPEG
jgi:hypothetical protein